MKKSFLIILTTFFFSISATGQFGDANKEVHNLHILAKTWGLLKYHHPNVKNCEGDWDQTLLSTLEKLDGAPQSSFGLILEEMIHEAGDISDLPDANMDIVTDDPRIYNIDRRWVRSLLVPRKIKMKLNHLYNVAEESPNCTVKYTNYLNFEKEKQYDTGLYPEKYMRILAMFRYWNIIDFLFPYKHQMDVNWNITFKKYILPITYAQDANEYHLEFKKLTVSINDSHSFFVSSTFNQWRGRYGRTFRVRFVEGKSVVVETKSNSGPSIGGAIEVGDVILSINGEATEDIRDYIRPYALGSNESVIEREINNLMISSSNLEELVEVEKKDGSIEQYNIRNTGLNTSNNNETWKVLSNECTEYGYIDMGLLMSNQIGAMVNDLWDKEVIIFDIRNYPNGTMWPLMPYLYDTAIFHSKITFPITEYPGTFYWIDHYVGSTNSRPTYEGKIIILMNDLTQSQAEFTIMGLEQHPGSIKIGSQTSGADGNTHYIDLPGEIRTYFTGIGIYYPDETPTQRVGIVPDIEVHQTIAGIREGRDEVLEAAMDCALLDGNNLESEEETNDESNTYTSTALDLSNHLVSDNKVDLSFSSYPNPVSNGTVNFEFNSHVSETVNYSIIDQLGRNIMNGSFADTAGYNIDVSDLLSGVYSITLSTTSQRATQNIVITE